jgi:4-hydroxybenzoate polyprenyltransferase
MATADRPRALAQARAVLVGMRPRQWVKNAFLFVGLIFSRSLGDTELVTRVLLGFALFCLAASAVYLWNDVIDAPHDRLHPAKRSRPVAAGTLSPAMALSWAAGLALTAVVGAFLLMPSFGLVTAVYLAMNVAYAMHLKHLVILDVMTIAMGFMLRVVAGTELAATTPSDWLIVCTITLSLFLGFSKRRHELAVTGGDAQRHRRVLQHYSMPFLDQMNTIAAAAAIMSYALYTVADDTVARFETRNLVFTIPFALYGVFRYLYLIHEKDGGGNPGDALVNDRALITTAVGWIIAVIIIVY